ncbi:MAG: nitroreductase family protein [Bacteroidales bacterium]
MENQLIELLQTRRSIRRYTTDIVSDEMLDQLVRTAMYAPSAHSKFPLHFIVIKDSIHKQAIMKVHPHASMLEHAAAVILVCGDTQLNPEIEYLSLDAAAATMNLLLAAHALHLGACWLGVYPKKERMQGIADHFHLPEHIIPLTGIALGHTEQIKPQPERYQAERIHTEVW